MTYKKEILQERFPYQMSESSKSCLNCDKKQINKLVQQKNKEIKILNRKVQKLEEELKKATTIAQQCSDANSNKQIYMQLIEKEIQKSQSLEQTLSKINVKIIKILGQLSIDDSILITPESGQDSKFLKKFKQFNMSENHQDADNNWIEIIDQLDSRIQIFKKKITDLNLLFSKFKQSAQQQIKQLKSEINQEIKNKETYRKLLTNSQLERNQIINKITNISTKQINLEVPKEQLLDHSKKLKCRLTEVQKYNKEFISNNVKDKEVELKKYMELFSQVKEVKQKSMIIGHTC